MLEIRFSELSSRARRGLAVVARGTTCVHVEPRGFRRGGSREPWGMVVNLHWGGRVIYFGKLREN